MEVIIIILLVFFLIFGIVKKVSDAEAEREKEENLNYYRSQIETKNNKISLLISEFRKEMIWFAFENKKIKSRQDDLPDQNDYQIFSIEKIIDQNLARDTDFFDKKRIYENFLSKGFPFPLLDNSELKIDTQTINAIQKEILNLPTRKQFDNICKVCEGRGVLPGCLKCRRGNFAIEKDEIGREICKFCDTLPNSRSSIDLIRCIACEGRGRYRFL